MSQRPSTFGPPGRASRGLLGAGVVLWPVPALVVVGLCLSGPALAVTVTLVCLLGLVGIGGALFRIGRSTRLTAGRSARGATDGQGGGLMLECALVLPIALMLVLLMIQSSLLMVGNLCVNYAAYCAARTAVVTVPLHAGPDEPHNEVGAAGTIKTERIRAAAVWAVMPVACGSRELPEGDAAALNTAIENLFETFGRDVPSWVGGRIARKLWYADRYTDVELAPPAAGDAYGNSEDLHVTVEHTFYLSVPYANRLYAWLDAANAMELDFGAGELGLLIRSTQVLTNEGPADYIEPDTFE